MTIQNTILNPPYFLNKMNLTFTLERWMSLPINQSVQMKVAYIIQEEVIIGSEQGMTFPTKIGTTMCNVLIDTGAARCCMSEKYYKKLQLAKIHLVQNVNVRSAAGSNLAPIGLVSYIFELGGTKFSGDFIVCKNLTRSLILGRDFLI